MKITFAELNIIEPILKNLEKEGYVHPTPVQAQAIPLLLEGKDLLACAQTGTGKTAAFAVPLLQKLALGRNAAPAQEGGRRRPALKALILSPTRELANQIFESLRTYGEMLGLRYATVYGGVGYREQIRSVERGVDIVVATPGRLMDLIAKKIISLKDIEVFILDEADQMFDMGFLKELQKLVPMLPEKRQTILFSATMPEPVAKLADKMLNNPERLIVSAVSSTARNIEQKVVFVNRNDKQQALHTIARQDGFKRAIVFSATKHGADKIVEHLEDQNILCDAIHGDKKQNVRQRILSKFRAGRINVLVATDVAARGIDVDGVTHVINYDMPNIPESYVHRIGRTGRAGAEGVAISFCDSSERRHLRSIEQLIKKPLVVIDNKELGLPELAQRPAASDRPKRRGGTGAPRPPRAFGGFDKGEGKPGRGFFKKSEGEGRRDFKSAGSESKSRKPFRFDDSFKRSDTGPKPRHEASNGRKERRGGERSFRRG